MSHRESVAQHVWELLVVAFEAGDLPRATRLGTLLDSIEEESDEQYMAGLLEV
jgi:hypothetical protein